MQLFIKFSEKKEYSNAMDCKVKFDLFCLTYDNDQVRNEVL